MDFIEVVQSDLEQLQQSLISATSNNSKLNRIVSFLTEIIDKTISDDIIDSTKQESEIQN